MSIPGQRSAQRSTRAAIAVQRALGRSAQDSGGMCGQIGLTLLPDEPGALPVRRRVLTVGEDGREVWTEDETGIRTAARTTVKDEDDHQEQEEGQSA